MTAALELSAIHLRHGPSHVLRGVDLRLQGGELVGLIGPNGAGKSSLMQVIAGTQRRDGGSVRIAGIDLDVDPLAARAALGVAVAPERLPALLSGRQCIELVADLRGQRDHLAQSWALAERLGFAPWLDHPVHACSLGTRQKLAIVQALIGQPPLLLLDEALNGLDPLAARALKDELRQRADAGSAVLLATHGLEVAERFLDRAVLLLDGRIAADWDRDCLRDFRADPRGGLEFAVAERLRGAHSS